MKVKNSEQLKTISGFSKMSKKDKIEWICTHFLGDSLNETQKVLTSFWLKGDKKLQEIFDGFSENTISNYITPFGVAPNFIINGKSYCIPMAIEESSVVAAASSAAKYWMNKGGFHAKVQSVTKVGQVHFLWKGQYSKLKNQLNELREYLVQKASYLTSNMVKRGGGIQKIELKQLTEVDQETFQLFVTFNTCDSMGANFINTVLESFGNSLKTFFLKNFDGKEKECDIIMAILSNYTPQCLVKVWVECPIEAFNTRKEIHGAYFANKFHKAVKIARNDPYRATTHNKGIFNGIDAVVLATGNDFRAVEACGHTYACKDGQYRSLSDCSIDNGIFKFWMDLPISVGTIGGLTKLHPLAKTSLELLGNPNAKELMQIIAVTGLAQNFGALRSLITTGIQKGHMKMHLLNILNFMEANESQKEKAVAHFKNKVISFTSVRLFLTNS